MAGVNPYIRKVEARRADRPFTVTFTDEETGRVTAVRVDDALDLGRLGLDGSLLDIAEAAGVQVNHTCGGVCACSTCHVYVTAGGRTCSPATEDEEDQLDKAPAVTPESRLSCQCVPDGSADLTVLVPRWNRNEVKERPH